MRIARPAKGVTEPDRDLGGSEQHADGRTDKSPPLSGPVPPTDRREAATFLSSGADSLLKPG